MSGKQPERRFRTVEEIDLSAEQQAIIDHIRSGPRGGLGGPFIPWLESPELADRAQKLGKFARYDTTLPTRLSELAILFTARRWSSQFEWHHHAPIARDAGLPEDVIDAIHRGEHPPFDADDEAAVYRFCEELYETTRVSRQTFEEARDHLGHQGVVELVGILGYYSLVSMTLNVFHVPLPGGAPLPFDEPPE